MRSVVQQNLTEDRIYFPGLDALRFFAAFSVLIAHVELIKFQLGIPNLNKEFQYLNFGGMGVYFFFVLSGFLITYLLCAEKDRFNSISIKQFYIRRILRIWPLYYLLVFLGFVVLPQFHFFDLFAKSFNQHYTGNLLLYLFILPNLAFSMYPPVPHIGHLWSIGVEEQFYLVWPVIVRYSKKILGTIIAVFVLYLLFKASILLVPAGLQQQRWYSVLKLFAGMSKFECMMAGAMGGVILQMRKQQWLKFIYNKGVLWLSLLFFPVLGFLSGYQSPFQNFMHVPLAFLFLILIMNISSNPDSFVKIKSQLLNRIGRVSYGIYMYHFIVVFVVVKTMKNLLVEYPIPANILVYLSSVVISIVLSLLSYRFVETYFIRKKHKFSKIVSGA